MGTVLRTGAYRIMVYTLDHPPAHVHVVGPDGRATIALGCPNGPASPLEASGIDPAALRHALAIISENLALLCSAWRAIH